MILIELRVNKATRWESRGSGKYKGKQFVRAFREPQRNQNVKT